MVVLRLGKQMARTADGDRRKMRCNMDPITIGLMGLAARKIYGWYAGNIPLNFEAETETDGEGAAVNVRFTWAPRRMQLWRGMCSRPGMPSCRGRIRSKTTVEIFCARGGGATADTGFSFRLERSRTRRQRSHTLRLVAVRLKTDVEPAKKLGYAELKLSLPAPQRWNKIDYIRPLIDLSMVVAADGLVLV